MTLQPSQHRAAAKQRLSQAQKPGRAILLHTVVVLLFSLLVTAIDYYLDQQISNTGGLRGMESRAILQTIQLVLQILQMILLPFWQVGYTYYVLQVAHGRSAGGADLLQGFRRFGPVLRLKAIMALMTVILIVAASYASTYDAGTGDDDGIRYRRCRPDRRLRRNDGNIRASHFRAFLPEFSGRRCVPVLPVPVCGTLAHGPSGLQSPGGDAGQPQGSAGQLESTASD